MSEKYLIGEGGWNAFVQQIQFYVSRGYTEYHLVKYPEHKQDKYLKIDQKLIEKYNANLNKDKAYYNKKENYCNFKFLRHGDAAIILKSKGNLRKNIVLDDVFQSVENEKIAVQIGEKVTLVIGYDEMKVTVFLDKKTYREVRATCLEYMDRQKYQKATDTFNQLNALPSWGGIVEQKIKMKKYLVKHLEQSLSAQKVKSLAYKMIISTKRTAVKVF